MSILKTKCIHSNILFSTSLKLPYIFVTRYLLEYEGYSFNIKDLCLMSQQALHSLYSTVKILLHECVELASTINFNLSKGCMMSQIGKNHYHDSF